MADGAERLERRGQRERAAMIVFLALNFGLSWSVAALLGLLGWNHEPRPLITELFTTSLLYAVTMGWQPLFATWVVRAWIEEDEPMNAGLRPGRPRTVIAAGLAGVLLVVGAASLAVLAQRLGWGQAAALGGTAESQTRWAETSILGGIGFVAVFMATLGLIVSQAFTEEVGWRGYFLTRLMQRCGRWRGLLLHGAIWGLWYAPVILFSSRDVSDATWRSAAFVLSCALLGVLFAWLRLASGSVVPVVFMNACLTLAAGMPYVLHGLDTGLRSAIFAPPGWLMMTLIVGVLAIGRWRRVVQTPEWPPSDPQGASLATPARAPSGRYLN